MFDGALQTAAKKVLGLIKMEEIFFDWRRFFLMLGSGRLNQHPCCFVYQWVEAENGLRDSFLFQHREVMHGIYFCMPRGESAAEKWRDIFITPLRGAQSQHFPQMHLPVSRWGQQQPEIGYIQIQVSHVSIRLLISTKNRNCHIETYF